MEALWKLEEKWNLSTQKAIAILFACTSILLIGICIAAAAWRRRRESVHHQAPCSKAAAAESVRWSRSNVRGSDDEREAAVAAPTPLLVKREIVGGQSHNSTAAVWQRPILMGEKCELPRFSGLILYDQRGIPLHQCHEQGLMFKKEIVPTSTKLRDLL